MGDAWECKEVWREWHRVSCVEVKGDRQLMSFALKMLSYNVLVSLHNLDMLNDTGGVEQAVAARVRAAWMKFRELGGILCTRGLL